MAFPAGRSHRQTLFTENEGSLLTSTHINDMVGSDNPRPQESVPGGLRFPGAHVCQTNCGHERSSMERGRNSQDP